MLFSIGFTLAILEVALRIILSGNQTVLVEFYQDKPFRTSNQYWKNWHFPNSQILQKADCFNAVYSSNEFGMRATQMKDSASFTIAVLGDSFVEGYGESDEFIFTSLLDSLTGKNIEVLNFGMSGGFGTIHELAQYENFVRYFKPDLVILCYLNYNDVHDNIKALNEGLINEKLDFKYPKATFEEAILEINKREQPESIPEIVKNLYVLSMAQRGGRAFYSFMQTAVNTRFNFRTYLANTYSLEASDKIKKGYDIAQVSLSRLAELTTADSIEFLVINLPDPYQVDENWLIASEKKFGMKLDPTLPNTIIKSMCNEINIDYYDMYPNALKYINDNELKFPYFSHECDNHPDREGHQYLANEIYSFLMNNNYLKF